MNMSLKVSEFLVNVKNCVIFIFTELGCFKLYKMRFGNKLIAEHILSEGNYSNLGTTGLDYPSEYCTTHHALMRSIFWSISIIRVVLNREAHSIG